MVWDLSLRLTNLGFVASHPATEQEILRGLRQFLFRKQSLGFDVGMDPLALPPALVALDPPLLRRAVEIVRAATEG